MQTHCLLLAESGFMPTLALVIFLMIFAGIVAYVFIIPKSAWQKDAQLPLEKPQQTKSEKEKKHG
jgi:cbb3-type cytochrome oxidase subunit 3